MKISLCAIAKNENRYIREWVEHYKNIGIDKIFLYDNNEIDGESFSEVIDDYILNNYVLVIDKRGVEKGLVYDKDGINLLTSCYINCYEQYGYLFDWMCFFDIDEFLSLSNEYNNIYDFLSDQKFNNYDTILIVWKLYGDNDLLHYEPKPVVERFTTISKTQTYGVKSIVRCGKRINDKRQENLIHRFIVDGLRRCYASGDIDTERNISYQAPIHIYNKQKVYLNHYITKSFDEYIIRHNNRHWGTGILNTKNKQTYDSCVKKYFMFNNKNNEKLLYILGKR